MKQLSRFILCILCLACTTRMLAKTYIVCVGIADYPGTYNDLRVSDNDALVVQNIFSKSGNAQTTYLTNGRATVQNVCNEMRTMFAQASAYDNIVLYFSGHGIPGGLCCYNGNLPYRQVFNIMKQCRAKNRILLVDACFAGKMRTTSQKDENYSNENIMFFLSSRTNEKSLESPYKNSLFTIFLERALRGGADTNRDKVITAQELFTFVHTGVVNASKNRQHPVMWGKFDNNMTIIKW